MTQWRKSSRSQGGQGECVEISTDVANASLVRDSRDPEGPRLVLTRAEFASLLNNIKAGDMG